MVKKPLASVQKPTPDPALLEPRPLAELRIDELTLLRMTRQAEKERAARAELALVQGRLNFLFQRWLGQDAAARAEQEKLQALQAEEKAAHEAYERLVLEVGERLGINMAEHAYDDETGALHRITPDAEPARN